MKALQFGSTVSIRSTRIAKGRKRLEVESHKAAATFGPCSPLFADPEPNQNLDLIANCCRRCVDKHEVGSASLYQHTIVAPHNLYQPKIEVSKLTHTFSFPFKTPLMLSTIDKNKRIPGYLQTTQYQQRQLSSNHTSPPLQITSQKVHCNLDTISWPTAKNMAPLPSNTQTEKKNLAQSSKYSEGSKYCKISTVILNYHTKNYKAHRKNIPPHMPFLCSTKRLTLNEISPSWMQEFINCDATKYNQHQLEQDQ